MKSGAWLPLAALCVAGCVSVPPSQSVPDEVSSALYGKTFSRVSYAPPTYVASTAGKASFGMIGALAMGSAGNDIVVKHNIQDPAIWISEQLAQELTQRGMFELAGPGGKEGSDDIAQLAKRHSDVQYLLDVRTIGWSHIYYPTDWTHYRVGYTARIRFIDVANQKVVAQLTCGAVEDDRSKAPTGDELLADEAARLKAELARGAEKCVEDAKALGLKRAPG